MKAIELYNTIISRFDHILVGSRAIKYHIPSFRESHDWDIKLENTDLLFEYLTTNKEKLEIQIEHAANPEYGGNLKCRILCEDGVYIDIVEGRQEYTLIQNTKVATLKSITEFKEHLLDMELGKIEPRIDVVKKHYFDLKKIKY
jgi:hypothetical protein